MTVVWDSQIPAGRKMVLLALADHANDDGGSCFPSVAKVARKCTMSERAVQGHIRDLGREGLIDLTERPGHSNSFRLHPDRIAAWTPADSAPPQILHPADSAPPPPQILHPTPADSAPITIIEPSLETPEKKGADAPPPPGELFEKPKPLGECTYAKYLEWCNQAGRPVVPGDHAVFGWQAQVGLSAEFLEVAWWKFERRFLEDEKGRRKRYTDWPRTFLNYVREGYLGLWHIDADGAYRLTTRGIQAQREKAASDATPTVDMQERAA